MSLHVSSARGSARRVVLSCDVAGCPVQVEPPPIEAWRNDSDAGSYARDRAVGWTHDPKRKTDYCPTHAAYATAPVAGAVAPRPTAAARDDAGNPLDRDEYARRLRDRLAAGSSPAVVAAELLEELAGVYRGESIGALAQEIAGLLNRRG